MNKNKGGNRQRFRQSGLRSKCLGLVAGAQRYISKHYLTLIPIIITIVGILVTAYLSYAEPDIRLVSRSSNETFFSNPVKNTNGDCLYYLSLKLRFQNLSIKGGHINDAKFTPMNLDTVQEYKLIEIDKSRFGWGEERDVEVKFSLSMAPQYCAAVSMVDKPITFGIYFYDNTGKLINQKDNGEFFVYKGSIKFGN